MIQRLEGKVALVSGGARGLGAAHVDLFTQQGAAVVFGDILDEDGAALADQLSEQGRRAVYTHLDVTKPEDWVHAVQVAHQHFGPLTTLVNNAAIVSFEGTEGETVPTFEKVISVNLEGQWHGMRAVLPDLVATGNGAIVNISSVYSLIGTADSVAYHASKGGVRIMTKATALEYATKGIRVNSVNPGSMDTPFGGAQTPEQYQATVDLIPMGRKANPREVAQASLFLASDEASYITGTELTVDGGWSAP